LALLVMMVFGAAFDAAVQQPALELRGSWRATANSRVFQGTWTAAIDPKTPNVAQGTWTLIEANRVRLQGTWAAEKLRAGWRGTWSARVASGRVGSPPSPSMTGTWQADIKDASLKTLVDMLQRTAQAQVDGTWRRGGMTGTWSLAGSPR
jgi:hypothetical protein